MEQALASPSLLTSNKCFSQRQAVLLRQRGPATREGTVQRREVVLKARRPLTIIAADSWGLTAEIMQPLWSLHASCGSAGILDRQLLSYIDPFPVCNQESPRA